MTGNIPVISGRDAVRAFLRTGFILLAGRGKGSHMVVFRANPRTILTIPDHRELKRGLLRGLIREAGMTVEEFRALLQ